MNPPRSLKREKSQLWNIYKSSRSLFGRSHPETLSAWRNFKDINEEIRDFAMKSQMDYECGVAEQISSNPKLFHSYLKHRKVGSPTVGPIKLTPSDELTDDPYAMASCFGRSFASVFNSEVLNNQMPHQQCYANTQSMLIQPGNVYSAIQSMNINSAMGDDGIHPRLLFALKDVLSLPLSMIFNSSLQTGTLPCQWLISIVVPIYKKSYRCDPLNYRPVSLTSVPCKLFEKLIAIHLMDYLQENHILSDHQYGFRAKFSTVDQLISTYNDVTGMVDQGRVVDLVFFDYSKAFDSVPHGVLLDKLYNLGIDGNILHWIRGFLTGRTMRVKVGCALSESFAVTSGVPQGSVLGPLLFLIFVNHVISNVNCFHKIFADDIKLYVGMEVSSESIDGPIPNFQQCINRLITNSSSWGLKMNGDKCVVMRFCRKKRIITSGLSPYHINNVPIRFVTSYSDLGVTIDQDLKFHSHVNKKVAMVNNLTTNLFSCTVSRTSGFLMNVYRSHVRPLLEYASPLWNVGYLGDVRKLERVQRRWTRAVTDLAELPYEVRLQRLNLFSVEGRMLRSDLILVYKTIHDLCAIKFDEIFSFSETDRTRGHPYKLFKPRSDIELRKRFFANRVINSWNSLSESTVMAESVDAFKAKLLVDLGPKLYEFS